MSPTTLQMGAPVPFKRLASPSLGKMLQPEASGTATVQVPYLKAGHVQWHGVALPEDLPLMWASPTDIQDLTPAAGDLLICEGGEVGRAALAPIDLPENTIIQNSLHLVRETDSACPRYLKYALEHVAASGWIDLICNKATIAHLTVDKLRELPTPYWGKQDQQRIATFLDEQTARIDALIAEKTTLAERLTELWGSELGGQLLGAEHSDRIKCLPNPWVRELPAGWAWAPLKTRLAANDGGVWGNEPTGDSDTVVLRSTEQKVDGAWAIVEPARRKIAKQDWESCVLKEGDLLVTKSSGSASHIGKTSLVDAEVAALQACYSNFMQRLRVNKSTLPKFVWYWMNSPLCREQLSFLSTTTSGLSNLNGSVLGCVYLSFPPLPVQEKIVSKLDEIKVSIDSLRQHCTAHVDRLREYRSSLISAAVTGQLDLSTFKEAA